MQFSIEMDEQTDDRHGNMISISNGHTNVPFIQYFITDIHAVPILLVTVNNARLCVSEREFFL